MLFIQKQNFEIFLDKKKIFELRKIILSRYFSCKRDKITFLELRKIILETRFFPSIRTRFVDKIKILDLRKLMLSRNLIKIIIL